MSIFKKIAVVALAFSIVSGVIAGNPIEKLGRGIASVAFSPMELLNKPVDVARNQGNIAGITTGVLYGVAFTIARIGVGVADVATFLVPLPNCSDNPLEVGWGYGPMAFRDTPYVVDVEHDPFDFFYEDDTLVQSDY